MIEFSLSPSSINLLNKSELIFYYNYISKSKSDTVVAQAYGKSGSVVHQVLEEYINDKSLNYEKRFEELWKQNNLYEDRVGMNKTLSYTLYLSCVLNGVQTINKLSSIKTEEKIKWLLKENNELKIYVTGIIDVQHTDLDGLKIIDWKTSSSMDSDTEEFKLQAKHYCYIIWKTKNTIPKSVTFHYLKLNKTKSYSFDENELRGYENYLNELANNLLQKGTNISNYDLGDVDFIFNSHKKKCELEKTRRLKNEVIKCIIHDNRILIDFDSMPSFFKSKLEELYTYKMKGAEFSYLYKRRIWDGTKCLLKNNSIPFGYIHHFESIVNQFNIKFNTNYKILYDDRRDKDVMNYQSNNKYKDNKIELRYYQKESVDVALQKKIGILNLGTSAGKTFISGELIKKVNKKTLLLVNRIELAKQTQKVFIDYLGVDVGLMIEGNLDIDKDVVVASIQTIFNTLKNKSKGYNELKKYLYSVNMVLYDECHGVSNSITYTYLQKYLSNVEYSIGLSGSPFRTDGADLEMNSVVGFVIYKKDTESLQQEGFISASECIFIDLENYTRYNNIVPNLDKDDDFHTIYNKCITENKFRNNAIMSISSVLKGKKLIICNRVTHAKYLHDNLIGSKLITGTTSKKDRKDIFDSFKKTDDSIIIGMSQIMSTGIDLPDLDIIINAAANKSDITTIQTIGRVLRKSENKQSGFFIDFLDEQFVFKKMSRQRMKVLKKYGHNIKIEKDIVKIEKYINKLIN